MRPIKFRAWDKKHSCWLDRKFYLSSNGVVQSGHPSSRDLSIWVYSKHDCELMQYTGLHDKNGVEIYVGDIVIGALVDNKPCQVVCRPPEYLLQYPSFNDSTMLILRDIPDKNHREVIGSIWENPELLKGIR